MHKAIGGSKIDHSNKNTTLPINNSKLEAKITYQRVKIFNIVVICIFLSILVATSAFAFALAACVAFHVLQDAINPVGNYTCSFQIHRLLKQNFNLNFTLKTSLEVV